MLIRSNGVQGTLFFTPVLCARGCTGNFDSACQHKVLTIHTLYAFPKKAGQIAARHGSQKVIGNCFVQIETRGWLQN
jgi:hypothetical protein